MPLLRLLSTLLWLPVNALQALGTVAWSALWIPIARIASALGGAGRGLALARRAWAPGLLALAGARLVVHGRERVDFGRPCLLVANHQSWMDVPALFRALPVDLYFVAKRELARVPLMGGYIRAMGMVFVERRTARRAVAGVDAATALLAAGRSVLSFPEGTRSRDGALGAFKSGGFQAAISSGAAVVPVALVGSGPVLPPGGFRVRPGTIEVRFGTPIDAAAYAPADRAGLAGAAHAAVAELLAAAAAGERSRRPAAVGARA
jgi:1-acyl-sn-glycerol-3-phosphate acyltransferase